MLRIINLKEFFTYTHLFSPALEPVHNAFYLFIVLGFCVLTSIFLYFLSPKKTIKFEKVFFRRIADALFYLPILLIFYIFIRQAGLQMLSQRIILLLLGFSWLIWLIFLVYYRLAVISKLYLEYDKKKKEEKYIRHGKR